MSVHKHRALVIGAGCLGLAIATVAVCGLLVYLNLFAPIDDASYFCQHPQPAPLADLSASQLLQECSSGKTVTIRRGETVAVDLKTWGGVDTSTGWRALGVSDSSVLATLVAPTYVRGQVPSGDEIAIYEGVRDGQAEITAMENSCGTFGCGGRHRWWAFVRVI